MRKSGGVGKKKQPDAIDEVEELLKLTEDDLLLKLTVNSHIKSKSSFDFLPESSHTNAIDPDLDRRLQALRSKPSKPNHKEVIAADHEDVDNLFARFAALKAPSKAPATSEQQHGNAVRDTNTLGIVDAEDEEDEVSKIINWAIDAARLDPSPSSDIDDDADADDEDDDTDGSSDDDTGRKVDRKKKATEK